MMLCPKCNGTSCVRIDPRTSEWKCTACWVPMVAAVLVREDDLREMQECFAAARRVVQNANHIMWDMGEFGWTGRGVDYVRFDRLRKAVGL